MDENTHSNWFLRARGLVLQADIGVTPAEVAQYQRVNALRKVGASLPLDDADRAVLEATKGERLAGLAVGIYGPDVTMGFAFQEAGDLIHLLDSLAASLANRIGLESPSAASLTAWTILRAYTQRAEENAQEEAAFFEVAVDAAQAAQPGGQKVTLPDGSELTITPTPPAETWGGRLNAAIPELDANIADPDSIEAKRFKAERTPDNGPDGWSMMVPADPMHPLHPSNLPPHEGAA